MKIAICGAGMAGAYLASRFERSNLSSKIDFDLFEVPERNFCKITSCAWGAQRDRFEHICETVGLEPEDYITDHKIVITSSFVRDDVPIKNMVMLDKPKFQQDLQNGRVEMLGPEGLPKQEQGAYDMVIDATGFKRAYLPEAQDDLLCKTYQKVAYCPGLEPATVYVTASHTGYAWAFPLSDDRWHIGFLTVKDRKIEPFDLKTFGKTNTTECSCVSYIRLSGVKGAQPFFSGNVWGVGESIGMVSPITGEGIIPSLECAEILTRSVENLVRKTRSWKKEQELYQKRVLGAFAWTDRERYFLEGMFQGDYHRKGMSFEALRGLARALYHAPLVALNQMKMYGIQFTSQMLAQNLFRELRGAAPRAPFAPNPEILI